MDRRPRRAARATPTGSTLAPVDRIRHVVVLMLENRSFDHMLGFLSLPRELGGEGRADVDGLKGDEVNEAGLERVPRTARTARTVRSSFQAPSLADGLSVDLPDHDLTPPFQLVPGRFPIHRADQTILSVNPPHGASSVRDQIGDQERPMSGFVEAYRKVLEAKGRRDVSPGAVMGYHTGEQVPTYRFLASNFLVCDRWHSSMPGPTWPNRMFFYAGRANNQAGNGNAVQAIVGAGQDADYPMPDVTLLDVLDDEDVDYAVYSDDIAWIRLFPGRRDENQRRFQSFDRDCREDRLPSFVLVDPNWSDLGPIDEANDDQAPADPIRGQLLVARIYESLRVSGRLDDTLFVVTYDEHGGFYDHVFPPPVPPEAQDPGDTDAAFDRYGVRVPALLVTPFVPVGGVSSLLFDHTSIARTVIDRFCPGATLGTRPQVATSLADALTERPEGRIVHPSAADVVAELEALLHARKESERRPGVQEVDGFLEEKLGKLKDLIRRLPLV